MVERRAGTLAQWDAILHAETIRVGCVVSLYHVVYDRLGTAHDGIDASGQRSTDGG